MVTPGTTPGAPPSHAIVLFDGKDLSKWQTMDKQTKAMGPAAWTLIENGYTYLERWTRRSRHEGEVR